MSQNHKHSVLTLKLSDYKPHARLLPPELKITSAHARLTRARRKSVYYVYTFGIGSKCLTGGYRAGAKVRRYT
jgi:hypothetical protein